MQPALNDASHGPAPAGGPNGHAAAAAVADLLPAVPRGPAPGPRTLRPVARGRWFGVLEFFVVVQLLSFGLLLLPGTQPLRFPVRALPYLLSAALLFYRSRGAARPAVRPRAARWLTAALVLLGLGLLHPDTAPAAGVAQWIFQFCIAAPLFWAARQPVDARRLERLLWLLLVSYGASAAVGALQVFYPDQFMPRDFSALLSDDYLGSLSYEGAGGQTIVRPPGLSDVPGGAAAGAISAAFLGLMFLTQSRQGTRARLLCAGLVLVGLFVLYLCQVRSYFLMLLVVVAAGAWVAWRRGRAAASLRLVLLCAGAVAAAFAWAVSIGGEEVSNRFLNMAEEGLLETFQQSRGGFLAATVGDYMWRYPFGAGLGRWGMMSFYFGSESGPEPLWAEIQLTGWLYDGGVLLWVLYGGAIVAALISAYRVAVRHPDEGIARGAQIIFCLNLLVAGQTFAGPSFNNQLGILFWFLTGVLHAAAAANGQPLSASPAARAPRYPWLAPGGSGAVVRPPRPVA